MTEKPFLLPVPNIDSELSDNTCDGVCSQCGECCTNMVALLPADISRIKRFMAINRIKKPEDHTSAYCLKVMNVKQTIDLTCPFLVITPGQTPRAKCKIYPVRPAVCRGFICRVAKDPTAMHEILNTLSNTLTREELAKLAKTTPVSMRETFFGTPWTAGRD